MQDGSGGVRAVMEESAERISVGLLRRRDGRGEHLDGLGRLAPVSTDDDEAILAAASIRSRSAPQIACSGP